MNNDYQFIYFQFLLDQYLILLFSKKTQDDMVQCYSCGSTVSGSWQLNYSGYNNGSYTGIDAYFAYNGPNWIYCFCSTCFNNGKFAHYLKAWYTAPINSIVQEEKNKVTAIYQLKLVAKDNEIQQLQSRQQAYKLKQQDFRTKQQAYQSLQLTLKQKQLQIAQLKTGQSTYQSKLSDYSILSKILSQESQKLILKTQEYYNGLERSFKITSNQFISNLTLQVNSVIKKFIEESVQSYKVQLGTIKLQYEKELEQLKQIRDQTLISWRSAKGVKGTSLFSDEDTQSTEKLFENKIKAKEQQLNLAIKAIEGIEAK